MTEWNDAMKFFVRISALLAAEKITATFRLKVSGHPMAYNHLEIDVHPSVRFKVKSLLTPALGPEFVVDYFTHPAAGPQDAVFVFPASRAWSEASFRSSNVAGSGRYPPLK